MTPARVAAIASALAATGIACRRHQSAPVAPRSCLILDGPHEAVGFDANFTITAKLVCSDLGAGHVDWRQLDGPAVRTMTPAPDGFTLTARMPPIAEVVGDPVPWGVVPVSPRTRGEVVLRATWSDDRGRTFTADARAVAADRSRGLPNTPVGVRIYLGGRQWHVTARPAGSRAALDTAGGETNLLPDVPGDWRLADGDGRTLALRAGRYDETPLDCGRAGCHPAITDAVATSPMTTVLARLMDRRPQSDYPLCALACHATGEPGARDGGFTHVASELGADGDMIDRRWDALPPDLHRLGGVGCLACHGPGAIPEASARWSVLRADVCATCHDAPPRYGHVVAWRQTAMARADQDPRAREKALCVRCHTTWGFLATVAKPERTPVDRRAPVDAGLVGITCSACHAVHDPRQAERAPRLLRATPTPALLAGVANSVCLPCHTPDAADDSPSASAAALVFGRGGLDPATGRPLAGEAPHAAVAGGCVGCHRDGPENVEHGAGHAFRAPAAKCTSCHPAKQLPSDVRTRAQDLWRRLRTDAPAGPTHAAPPIGAADRGTPRGRAIWDLLLVLEDPAAETHNARYARALLAAAETALATGDREGRAR